MLILKELIQCFALFYVDDPSLLSLNYKDLYIFFELIAYI